MSNRKRYQRPVAWLALLVLVIVTACSNGGSGASGGSSEGTEEDKPTISVWTGLNMNAAVTITSLNEVSAIKEWEQQANVTFEFQHPAVGTEREQLNILLASNRLPDALMIGDGELSGGAVKAYDDGVIIRLNELIDEYAPNLKRILEENPDVQKQLMSDEGDIFFLPHLRLGEYKSFGGMMIRQDWLDDLGLEQPETIDEWEQVLRAFKEKGVESPLLIGAPPKMAVMGATTPNFPEAFGVSTGYYLENGEVKYGPIEEGYREFLTTYNRWYEEGLIDEDFVTNDQKTYDAKVTSGRVGAFFGYVGSGISKYLPALQQSDPNARIEAVQFPVLNPGDEPINTGRSWEWPKFGVVITSSNQNPEATVRAFDYLFSEEGNLLRNFGIEGETYTLEDGEPRYTDLILDNPEDLTLAQAIAKYFFSSTPFVGMDDDRYLDQYYQLDGQKEAIQRYAEYADNSLDHLLPPVSFTTGEANELSKINADSTTYRDEMLIKFILGVEPMDNFDSYVQQMKRFNVERGVEIHQEAYERYQTRS